MAKLKGAAKAAFLRRMNKGRVKAGLKKIGSKTKSAVKKRTKRKSGSKRSSSNRSKRSGSSTMAKKKGGSKKGASLKTRLVKFGAGAGIAVAVSLVANALKRNEINAAAPILDAAAGIGIEGQVGTAIVRTVVPLIRGVNGGGGNGNMALEGA